MICKIENCFKKDQKNQELSLQDYMRLGANCSQHSILVLIPFRKDKKKVKAGKSRHASIISFIYKK